MPAPDVSAPDVPAPDVPTAEAPTAVPPDAAEPVRPMGSAGYSMRPAMIVAGLAVLIVGVFVTIGLVTTGPAQPTDTSTTPRAIAGTPLPAVPATSALAVITGNGQPPPNILNSVSIPAGATRVSHQNNSAASAQYDEQVEMISDASQGALRTFYLLDMKAQGWQISGSGPADHDPGAFEVLGTKAGSDGYYWEMGAVISATTFGPHAPPAGSTDFTIRLFQVPDPS